jgi:hypothetical protein
VCEHAEAAEAAANAAKRAIARRCERKVNLQQEKPNDWRLEKHR